MNLSFDYTLQFGILAIDGAFELARRANHEPAFCGEVPLEGAVNADVTFATDFAFNGGALNHSVDCQIRCYFIVSCHVQCVFRKQD
jgi:hypothetical protein